MRGQWSEGAGVVGVSEVFAPGYIEEDEDLETMRFQADEARKVIGPVNNLDFTKYR